MFDSFLIMFSDLFEAVISLNTFRGLFMIFLGLIIFMFVLRFVRVR